ncbi:N-acetylmuramoyl-L-alanine amidase [Longimicrobium sp.]|uniref:N-acetylmuramoyl-L-alanine amidase n=1 Tax=Longimicrobium sp. TaxID=2029185 RepID=UPI002E30A247|nr:N-acetylmuramoyl-L-alanine amidase [Longimicrobium sp.]HEX6040288.1 N-acetylmuramoyl-L-alanine amidase [Longimicrobium sp.]
MIILDPGHGGARPDGLPGIDRGASAGGHNESDVALLYASELARALAARGVSTWSTRTGENLSLSLQERVRLANAKPGAEAFVSLHCNASGSPAAEGFQVFHARGSEKGARLGASIVRAVAAGIMGLPRAPLVFPDQSVHCGYTQAARAHIETLRPDLSWEKKDEAVRARFGKTNGYRRLLVLRETQMPAVLVELDFLTSPAARERLLDDGYRRALSDAIALGICRWIHPFADW